ncbi:MAG: exodeoxyribonuclease VII small subunit [Salinisphaera sp.]|nr:exodeoxyribonuclease VII small subunit [Salinisphaera sp.]MDN5937910.1 exodeoxyribonuclease VII small subunit [Salinisphaera sp.]
MPKKDAKTEPDALTDFEASLGQLETLVQALESGDIGLEDSLAKFEQGVKLARHCQQVLKDAELRVEQLLETEDGAKTVAFEPPEE